MEYTVLLEKLTCSQLGKKFPAFYGIPKVHYRIHKIPMQSNINPVHASPSHLFQYYFPSTLRSPKSFLSIRSHHQNRVDTSPVPHTCHMTPPAPSSFFLI